MRVATFWVALTMLLAGCAGPAAEQRAGGTIEVKIIAFNDFHGNLEPPGDQLEIAGPDGGTRKIDAGGAARLASAVKRLRAGTPNSMVVSAGDLIGASPFTSAQFLDEPTIEAMNLVGVDLNAVGNHEFDKGRAELLRIQRGGCARYTARVPCALNGTFAGARFAFLAANVLTEDGEPLSPGYAVRSFGGGATRVRVAFIGMTLRGTPLLVTPAGVTGLTFADEAETANALAVRLRREGADAVVLLIHQGAQTDRGVADPGYMGLSGDLLPIVDRLDPAVDLVVSGHTHRAYVCDYVRKGGGRPILLTSAGKYGTLLTDITLTVDSRAHRVVSRRAETVVVRGVGGGTEVPGFAPDPAVAALVGRYAAAAAAARPVGRLSAPVIRERLASGERVLGLLIADAQLAATRAPTAGGAEIAFMNAGGLRADLTPGPDGTLTFGQLFAVQPFGNRILVKSFTGGQLRAVLEQQFDDAEPELLLPSVGLRYAYDLSRPVGARAFDVTVNGRPLRDDASYRVAVSEFLSSGGDGFSAFAAGVDPVAGPQDIDALVAYFAGGKTVKPPQAGRVRDATPPGTKTLKKTGS